MQNISFTQYTILLNKLNYISYLEWPKYKTAKSLLYTVYRSRNQNSYEGNDREKGKFLGNSEKQSALELR